MKRLVFTTAMILASLWLYSQEMFLKKETTKIDENWEVYALYNYEDNMDVQSIFQVTQNGDTAISRFYLNGRIHEEVTPNLTTQFEYQGDSVMEYRKQNDGSFQLSFVYFMNGAHEVVEYKIVDNEGNYVGSTTQDWEFGNCVETLNSIGGQQFMEYSLFVRNPYLNQNKYFKRGYPGSYNQLIVGDFLTFGYEFNVINTLNDFPTEILFSDTFGNEWTIYYEYHDPSGDGEGITLSDPEVLEVLYFNALGQRIEKPDEGFYIKKEITPKGSSTRKYFTR